MKLKSDRQRRCKVKTRKIRVLSHWNQIIGELIRNHKDRNIYLLNISVAPIKCDYLFAENYLLSRRCRDIREIFNSHSFDKISLITYLRFVTLTYIRLI